MALPAPLSKKFREVLGRDAGEDFVTWLQEMRTEHEQHMATIEGLREEMRQEMAALRQELVGLIQASEARLTDRIGRVELRVAEVKADLMKWSFVFWVGAVTAVAALAGVLR